MKPALILLAALLAGGTATATLAKTPISLPASPSRVAAQPSAKETAPPATKPKPAPTKPTTPPTSGPKFGNIPGESVEPRHDSW